MWVTWEATTRCGVSYIYIYPIVYLSMEIQDPRPPPEVYGKGTHHPSLSSHRPLRQQPDSAFARTEEPMEAQQIPSQTPDRATNWVYLLRLLLLLLRLLLIDAEVRLSNIRPKQMDT